MNLSSQENVVKLIDHSFKKDRLSHAYLFVGEKGSNKVAIAKYFAIKFYCRNACLTCPTCMKIIENKHQNIYYIEPDGQNIKKEQIENLQREFSKTSLEDGARIYIINHADKMNQSASNSLLKFIEEPENANTYGILLTENLSDILPTILSRCQVIYFKNNDPKTLTEELLVQGIEITYAKILPLFSNNYEQAKNLIEQASFLSILDRVLMTGKLLSKNYQELVRFLKDEEEFIFENKNNIILFIDLFILYLKDCLKVSFDDELINFDYEMDAIRALGKKENKKFLNEKITMLIDIKYRLNYNINIRLVWDYLLIQLKKGE